MKSANVSHRIIPYFVPALGVRLRATILACAGLLTLSARGQFVPGSGGSIPDIAPLAGVTDQIGGLMVLKSDRKNSYFGGGTEAELDLTFLPPSAHGASGYRLQRSPGAKSTWEDHPWGAGFLETTSSDQDNFSFAPLGTYSYRLLVQGGAKNGFVSNVVSAGPSSVDTRFASWNLDESMYITGVMWPWLGRGLTASLTVRRLSDDAEVGGGLSYQWYRVNPLSGQMTAIDKATGPTYVTTEADVGGYHHLCRATGNGTTTGGFIQVMSSGGVMIPNNSYVAELASNGFVLNLHKSVPSLAPADLRLSYWDGSEQQEVPVTAVAPVGSNASFRVAAAIPAGVQQLTLNNHSAVWGLGSEVAPGHFMEFLQINVPAGGFAPEIAVERPDGKGLTDGKGSQGFGKALVGKTGAANTYTIRNTGTANLTGLRIGKTGSHPGDFAVSGPGVARLEPGGSTTFKVTFKPSAAGARSCALLIASNDKNENPFDVVLTGTGVVPAPEIVVQEPPGSRLVDNESKRSFGTAKAGGTGVRKVFTIKNTGTAALKGLAVRVTGTHANDFIVTVPKTIQLAPGGTTTFKATFKPTAKGKRDAVIKIRSNDADEDPFEVTVTGLGA